MNSPHCGICGAAYNKPTAKFCSKCGARKAAARRPSGLPASNLQQQQQQMQTFSPSSTLPATDSTTVYVDAGPARPATSVSSSSNVAGKSTLDRGGRMAASANVIASKGLTVTPVAGTNAGEAVNTAEEEYETISPSPEEEAQYSAWATLGPEGITPDMLQTSNAEDLRQWRKGHLVGRGTYGSVYLGLLPDGAFYAVKVVELGGKTDAFNVKELVSLSREINMMQRLRHRNLCTFKGVYYDASSTSICMFMEYIGGGSLSSVVKKFKPLPAEVVRKWTKQLLSGLLYLHTQNIIHRDIKGDNVLVDTSASPGSDAQIKLVDFGAAKRVSDAVSQSRTVIGTPYWMAPEVVNMTGSESGYSYKADVWSVGCTVAEMLTGKPPWPSKPNAPAAIMMIASAQGMPTELPEKEATPGCLDFMKKCFERQPDNRPTVEELLTHPWITGAIH